MNYEWLDLLSRGYVGSRNGVAQSLKLKSCVDFAEIAKVEIVCQFHPDGPSRDDRSISPRVYRNLDQI